MTRELQGRVALVTGGGGGLGEALCRNLAAAGATVVSADMRLDAAEQVAAGIRAAGGAASSLRLDVRDLRSAELGLAALLDRHGRLDVLVNNAGTDVTASVEELSFEDFDRVIAVNLRGPFVLSKLALAALRGSGRGHIVNIVSTAAKRAWPNASAYHASKWGLLGLSHALFCDARRHGVKVTAVVAGGMRTPFILERFPGTDPGVLQDPDNVAATVRFVLAQPAETVVPEILVIPARETSWP